MHPIFEMVEMIFPPFAKLQTFDPVAQDKFTFEQGGKHALCIRGMSLCSGTIGSGTAAHTSCETRQRDACSITSGMPRKHIYIWVEVCLLKLSGWEMRYCAVFR